MDLKADLHRSLRDKRAVVVAKCDGLSEHDVRRPLTPTGTNLLGLVKHLTGIEFGYLGSCVGRPPAPGTLSWYDDGSVWQGADMWARPDEARDDLLALYRDAWRHSDESIATLGLDAPADVDWWSEDRRHTTLGHLVVRVVAETAQHAGQADVVCELIDPTAARDPEVGDGAVWDAWVDTVARAAEPFRAQSSGSSSDPSSK